MQWSKLWYFLLKLVPCCDGLGSVFAPLYHICSTALSDIENKLKADYAKIVPNRGSYSPKALARLQLTHYNHSILFRIGLCLFFNTSDMLDIRALFFCYFKFFLYLSWWYRNQKVNPMLCATDKSYEKLDAKPKKEPSLRLGPFRPLVSVFGF